MKLSSFIAVLSSTAFILVSVAYFVAPRSETKTVEKKVFYERYTVLGIKKFLLKNGVGYAWVERAQINRKADCFSTVLIDDKHVFSYCGLRDR